MDRNIYSRLYGVIDHGPDNDLSWDLYQSQAVSRLRDISLSSTPPRCAPHGMAASRFEHSVGVGFLARKLCDWRSSLAEHRDLLIASSLCHDIGSPPFSHISELFFWDLTSKTHEQQTAELLAPKSELADILSSYKVDPEQVVQIINGEHPQLGQIIAGSIDLDNIDNSIHLLVSLGYQTNKYHPLQLLKAFRYRNESLYLDTSYLSEILGWAEARNKLYSILHSEPNLSSATMLYRALEFAYHGKHIGEQFFSLDESDALYVLRRRSGTKANLIVERALRWQQYPLIYQHAQKEEDPRLVGLYSNWKARKRLTDELAQRLNIPTTDLVMYVGRDRGEKSIDLPFVGDRADAVTQLFSNRKGDQRFALLAHKEHLRLRDSKKVATAVEKALSDLPESDGEQHVFF